MDNETPNNQNQSPNSLSTETSQQPYSENNKEPFTPGYIVPDISSQKSLIDDLKPKTSRRAIVFGIIFAISVVMLIGIFTFRIVKEAQKQTSKTHSINTNSNSLSQNPLNNGSINSQVQYCSNAVNALLTC